MKNKIFLLAIISVFLFSGQLTLAQTVEQKVTLDEKTIVKGYTIKYKNSLFSVGVKPKSFLTKTTFSLQKKDSVTSEINGLKTLSAIYVVNFTNRSEKPISLNLNWQSFSNQPKNIYWRRNETSAWQQLPSKTVNKSTSAEIIEAGEIVLLENKPKTLADVTKHISAKNVAVLDAETGKVLYTKNADQVKPIASLTKLMTAMVFLERPQPWTVVSNITSEDKDIPVTIGLKTNETIEVKGLWYAMLTKSANDAAKAIARLSGLDKNNFVQRMNTWAKELDLKKSRFADPSGLDAKNTSTALEVAQIARAAFTYPDITQAVGTKEVKLKTNNTNREIVIKNSTTLFDSDLKIDAAKTGYTTEAGRCQIIRAIGEKRKVIVVVLDSAIGQHTTDAYDLGSWFTKN